MLNQTKKHRLIIFLILFFLAWGERVLFDLGPNVELVTTTMLIAGFYLGIREGIALPFLVMMLSDLVIGTSPIFIFTWTGMVVPALVGGLFFQKQVKRRAFAKIKKGLVSGLGANLFFYLWTNFGVWLLDSWGMYEKNLAGLINCYINGIPFLRIQIVGTLVFVCLGICLIELVREVKDFGRMHICINNWEIGNKHLSSNRL
jgi:uncharacterized membrane protein